LYKLEGQEAPVVSHRVDFMTSALQLKVEHACQAAAMNWRALYKNAGS
jgi:hypothetical protein